MGVKARKVIIRVATFDQGKTKWSGCVRHGEGAGPMPLKDDGDLKACIILFFLFNSKRTNSIQCSSRVQWLADLLISISGAFSLLSSSNLDVKLYLAEQGWPRGRGFRVQALSLYLSSCLAYATQGSSSLSWPRQQIQPFTFRIAILFCNIRCIS